MSGRTPDRIEVFNFIDDFRSPSVGGQNIVTLPEYFLRNGYHTFGTGLLKRFRNTADCVTRQGLPPQ